MAVIKKGFIKLWIKIVTFLIGILGINNCFRISGDDVTPVYGVSVMYGVPTADYSVLGVIKSADTKAAIKGLSVKFKSGYKLKDATTDDTGAYQIGCTDNYYSAVVFQIKDVDGIANGSFIDRDVTADFSAAVFTGGDNSWFMGKASINLDVELNRKP
jgi:putative lipoprotein (rSAM/lipoprotein system)